MALLDARAAGICVLASDIPENREVIADAGFAFEAGDVIDLQRMHAMLRSDPARWAHVLEMKPAGRKAA